MKQQERPSAPNRVAAANLLIHFIAVSIPSLIHYGFQDPALTLKVGGAVIFPAFVWLGLREGKQSPPWLSPLSFYFLWYATGLGLSAIYYGSFLEAQGSVPFSRVEVGAEDVAAGCLVFLLGSFALHLGIQLRRPAPPRTGSSSLTLLSASPRLAWLIGLWSIGLWSSVSLTPGTALGSLSGILQILALSVMTLYALTPHQILRLSAGTYWVLFALGSLGVLWGLLASYSKAFILFSFVPLICALWVRPRTRKLLPVAIALVGAIGLLVVYPVVNAARSTPLNPGERAADRLIREFLEQNAAEAVVDPGETFEAYLQRQFDPTPVGFIVAETRVTGYLDGESLAFLPAAVVPRALWPDKPSVTRGGWFTYYLGAADRPDLATTSTGMTATGELYWNFGLVGVVFGMLIIGLIIGSLWRLAGAEPRRSPLRMLLYLVLTLNMPNMPEAVATIAGLAAAAAVFIFLLKIVPIARIDPAASQEVSLVTR